MDPKGEQDTDDKIATHVWIGLTASRARDGFNRNLLDACFAYFVECKNRGAETGLGIATNKDSRIGFTSRVISQARSNLCCVDELCRVLPLFPVVGAVFGYLEIDRRVVWIRGPR